LFHLPGYRQAFPEECAISGEKGQEVDPVREKYRCSYLA
jgi:hypothetical protein